jgi:hypothetical protein
MARALTMLLALVSLAACTMPPTAPRKAAAETSCASAQDCDLKWTRATEWLRAHSYYKIRTLNDSEIVTDTSVATYPGYRVTKLAQPDGSARISVQVTCGAMVIGCQPDQEAQARVSDLLRAMDGTGP